MPTIYPPLSIGARRRLEMFKREACKPSWIRPMAWRDVRFATLKTPTGFDTGRQFGAPCFYGFHVDGYFRGERDTHDIADIRHDGWYTDVDAQESAIGIVGRLTHGRFIAGYRWTSNGERVYYPEVFDDADDAARMADEHARVFAESAREDSERYDTMARAESDVESAESEFRKQWILYRAVRHSWIADNARWHAAMVRATDDVQQCIEDIREARETLANATADYNRG